jgi:hypothetical protein
VVNAQLVPPPRRRIAATDGGAKLTLHVDLGAVASQLREPRWDTAKLAARDVQTAVIDEIGTPRAIAKASAPTEVATPGLAAAGVVFVPYGDRRWEPQDVDGTLGLGFFAQHDVWQSWDAKRYYVVPRQAVAPAVRIGRWDSPVLAACKQVGCVGLRVTDPLNGQPAEPGRPHPGLVLSVTREEVAGGMPLELMIEATAQPALPRLLINMPGHVDKLLHQLPAAFVGATLAVVDASPFPRACPTRDGCVDLLAP